MAARIRSFVWFTPGFTVGLGIASQISGELALVACRGARILYGGWLSLSGSGVSRTRAYTMPFGAKGALLCRLSLNGMRVLVDAG